MGIQNIVKQNTVPAFAFWDKSNNKNTLVIATHGIEKKSGKTPKNELQKAEAVRIIYFENKR